MTLNRRTPGGQMRPRTTAQLEAARRKHERRDQKLLEASKPAEEIQAEVPALGVSVGETVKSKESLT